MAEYLEFKHQDPKAFNSEWRKAPRWHDLRFGIYSYRLFGVVYDRPGPEFDEAYAKLKMWRKLRDKK